MAAVVGPISVQHPEFRHGRVTFFLPFKIILDVQEILKSHGKPKGTVKSLKFLLRHGGKPIHYFHVFWLLKLIQQRFRLFQASFPGIHRVDAVFFDGVKLAAADFPLNHIGGGGTDDGCFIFIEQLHALFRRIRPLVVLPRQIFHAEYLRVPGFKFLLVNIVYGRLGKHRSQRFLVSFLRNMLHIVADEHPHASH